MRKKKGFTLIELIVSIFIFSLIVTSVVAVFVSTVQTYSKGRSIKTLKEDIEYATLSIMKDVRMGKIETPDHDHSYSSPSSSVMVKKNQDGSNVCYRLTSTTLDICENAGTDCDSCSSPGYRSLVSLGPDMNFASSAGFFFKRTYPLPPDNPELRGWLEINLNIEIASGKEMSADSIEYQTIVSSRDYGWEETNP